MSDMPGKGRKREERQGSLSTARNQAHAAGDARCEDQVTL